MNTEEQNQTKHLIPGLHFAMKHELSQSEMEIFWALNQKPMSSNDLVQLTKRHTSTVNNALTRLKLKKLIKCSTIIMATKVYSINCEVLR